MGNPEIQTVFENRTADTILRPVFGYSLVDCYRKRIENRIHKSRHIARQTVNTTRRLCELLGTSLPQQRQFMAAAEVHQFGFLSLPRGVCLKPASMYSEEDLAHYRRYPELGAASLSLHEGWEEIARIVRHHREDYSGNGYPARLATHHIPLGSRIIRIAADFAQSIQDDGLTVGLRRLEAGAERFYDPKLVQLLTVGTVSGRACIPLLNRSVDSPML